MLEQKPPLPPNEYPIQFKYIPTEEQRQYCLSLKGVTHAWIVRDRILYKTDGTVDPASVEYEVRHASLR
jgi:hypothetical protein